MTEEQTEPKQERRSDSQLAREECCQYKDGDLCCWGDHCKVTRNEQCDWFEKSIRESTPVGALTSRMVNGLLYRMLQDCGGLAVTQAFFDNMPESLPISAQYDETNDLWQFCVRKPRQRQPILKPKRKVITDV